MKPTLEVHLTPEGRLRARIVRKGAKWRTYASFDEAVKDHLKEFPEGFFIDYGAEGETT
jgi:flagellum-specific peptidoglycan hydrolase FlgJ